MILESLRCSLERPWGGFWQEKIRSEKMMKKKRVKAIASAGNAYPGEEGFREDNRSPGDEWARSNTPSPGGGRIVCASRHPPRPPHGWLLSRPVKRVILPCPHGYYDSNIKVLYFYIVP